MVCVQLCLLSAVVCKKLTGQVWISMTDGVCKCALNCISEEGCNITVLAFPVNLTCQLVLVGTLTRGGELHHHFILKV